MRKINNILIGICLILLSGFFINTCNASIDIYYPDNSTTKIWIANETTSTYNYYTGNSIPTDNYTCIVLKNQINESVDLIDDPITFVNSFVKIFYAVVFCFGIITFAYIFKRILI